jgi:hypothetical protein
MLLEITGALLLARRPESLWRDDERVMALGAWAAEIVSRPAYRDRVLRHPHLIRLYAAPIVYLAVSGWPVSGWQTLVERATNSRYHDAHEELPFRRLDLAHTTYLAGFGDLLSATVKWVPGTLLGQFRDIVDFTDNDLYSLTHTVFYATDFGRVPSHDIVPEPGRRAWIGYAVRALLGAAARRRDWDLSAELLITAWCLGDAPPMEDAVWRGISASQLKDGSVPGPFFSEAEVAGLEPLAAREYHVVNSYHTTLVSWMAVVVGGDRRNRTGVLPSTEPDLDLATLVAECSTAASRGRQWLASVFEDAHGPDLSQSVLEPSEPLYDCLFRNEEASQITRYLRSVGDRSGPSDVALPWSILVLEAIRGYDLTTAAECIRELSRSLPNAPLLPGFARYLLRQQQTDGRFGFLGPELTVLAGQSPRVAHEGVYAPIARACVGALDNLVVRASAFL